MTRPVSVPGASPRSSAEVAVKEAGLGIAFNCKEEKLKKAADIVIEKKDLREILKYILD